jgi:hypothetical protein
VREVLRASFSLPGLFLPARLNGTLHIDGGVLDTCRYARSGTTRARSSRSTSPPARASQGAPCRPGCRRFRRPCSGRC